MDEHERCANRKWDLCCLAVLVVLTVGLRIWQIAHTEVASRDSIMYIRMGWQLEHEPWLQVLPTSPQHPGYPLAVLGMSLPVRHFIPDDLPRAWQLSGQLVSALASVLLLVPMFYLGSEVFERRIAFWSCLLFQCLPTSGKIMGDGLSDPLFLLFACSALLLASLALRKQSWRLFALTGLACGLAYLVRPEGALILGSTGLVLLAMQLSRRWRQSWRQVLVSGSALALASMAVMSPYMLAIRGLTVKNTPNIMINQQRPDADWERRLRPQASEQDERHSRATLPGSVLLAMFMGPGDPTFDQELASIKDENDFRNYRPSSRYLWALKAFIFEAGKGFFYVIWLPGLLGLWWFRDRVRELPGLWVGSLTCLILTTLLFRMAEKMGYLSDRHLLLLIMCSMYWAVAGTFYLGEKLAVGAARLWPSLAGRSWTNARVWSLGLMLLFTLAPLPRTLSRLHAERAGFRSLGQWLARNTEPGDFIDDPYCWAYFYAGRVFLEGCQGLKMHRPSCYYVVREEVPNRSRARCIQFWENVIVELMKKRDAKIIHEEYVRRGRNSSTLQVWEVPGPYQSRPQPPLPGQRQ